MRDCLRDSDQSEKTSNARLFAMQACFKLSVKLSFVRRLGVCLCELGSASLPECQRDRAEPGMPARGSGCLPVCSLSEPQATCANLSCLHHEPACGAAGAAIPLTQSADSPTFHWHDLVRPVLGCSHTYSNPQGWGKRRILLWSIPNCFYTLGDRWGFGLPALGESFSSVEGSRREPRRHTSMGMRKQVLH